MTRKNLLLTVLLTGLLLTASAAAQEVKVQVPEEDAGAGEVAEAESPAETPDALVLPPGTQIPMELQNTVNTRNSRDGDRVYFVTIFPVLHEGRIVIPVGSYVRGTLAKVKRPGRVKGRAELHVRFDELILPNGYRVDLNASLSNTGTRGNEDADRAEGGIKGESTKARDAATIADMTVTGATLGAATTLSRGGIRAGAGIGAAVGLATVLLTRGKDLVLERGTTIEVTLDRPLPLDPALASFAWTDYSSGRRDRR